MIFLYAYFPSISAKKIFGSLQDSFMVWSFLLNGHLTSPRPNGLTSSYSSCIRKSGLAPNQGYISFTKNPQNEQTFNGWLCSSFHSKYLFIPFISLPFPHLMAAGNFCKRTFCSTFLSMDVGWIFFSAFHDGTKI